MNGGSCVHDEAANKRLRKCTAGYPGPSCSVHETDTALSTTTEPPTAQSLPAQLPSASGPATNVIERVSVWLLVFAMTAFVLFGTYMKKREKTEVVERMRLFEDVETSEEQEDQMCSFSYVLGFRNNKAEGLLTPNKIAPLHDIEGRILPLDLMQNKKTNKCENSIKIY